MSEAGKITVAFFGDVVGGPGREVLAAAVKQLRSREALDVIIVNGENARNGSGLHPEGYRDIRRAGADAVTLGDHCFADMRIGTTLDAPEEPVCRPANLSSDAPGKWAVCAKPGGDGRPGIWVIPLLGRLFMKIPADDPFAALDRAIAAILERDGDALIVVEMHAEATSEKGAMAWYALKRWPGRVVAVVGTHTHVQTADARILSTDEGAVAAITDLGMTGAQESVIGREIDDVLALMTTQRPVRLAVAATDPAACGALLRIDTVARRATGIEAFVIRP